MSTSERGILFPPKTEHKEHISNGVLSHILIIPDNNRTWARMHNKSVAEGYQIGAKRMMEVARKACDIEDIHYLTYIVATGDNLKKRPPEELTTVWEAVSKEIAEGGLPQIITDKKVKVQTVGSPEKVNHPVSDTLLSMERQTEKNKGLVITFGLGYDPHDEMQQALRESTSNDWEEIKKHLVLAKKGLPDITAIIRVGEEKRLSGLFPNASSGAELLFNDAVTWPEYTADVFERDTNSLRRRVRKKGA